ncbi:MAG: phage Gp37/Gp68 family protein [Acidobacteriota bacterium]
MGQRSKIEWTEATWNPVSGCTKISEGCRNCYAEKMSLRLKSIGVKKYKDGFSLAIHPETLNDPLEWKKSKIIFVCSMSDLFHEDVPEDFILKVFKIMNRARHHIFQVLTKRSERLVELNKKIRWTENIWLGVTVESELNIGRVDNLIKTDASVKFLSLEPLLSEIPGIPLDCIDWVIVGGESGFNARPIHPDWVRNIQQQCFSSNVPFFFKQWGGKNKKKNGRLLDGREYLQMPDANKFKGL